MNAPRAFLEPLLHDVSNRTFIGPIPNVRCPDWALRPSARSADVYPFRILHRSSSQAESLPTIIWEARARNIVVIAVFQAVGQAIARYGRDIVDALLYNGGVGTLFLHGGGEHDVMTRLEELGGPMWVPQTTSTSSRSATGPLAGFRWLDVTHSASTNQGWVKVLVRESLWSSWQPAVLDHWRTTTRDRRRITCVDGTPLRTQEETVERDEERH